MTSVGRYTVPLVALALITYFLYQVHHVLLPFVLAGTLAYVLNPLVSLFEGRGVRRRAAVFLVFGIGLIGLSIALYAFVSMATLEAGRITTDWPRFVARFKGVTLLLQSLGQRFPFLFPTMGAGHSMIGPEQMWQRTPKVIALVEVVLLTPFLSLFFMLDGLTLRNALLELAPPRYVEMLLSILVEVDHSLGNYVRGLCLQALFLGLVSGVAFASVGLHYSFPIAVGVAATSMIPLVGPLSALIAGCTVALVQWGTLSAVLKVAMIAIGIRLIDDWVLHPYILRKAVHIHPVITVFSLMAGGSLFGFWGLLFAVPVVCMVKVVLGVAWDWYRSEYGLRHDPLPVEVSHLPII